MLLPKSKPKSAPGRKVHRPRQRGRDQTDWIRKDRKDGYVFAAPLCPNKKREKIKEEVSESIIDFFPSNNFVGEYNG